MGLRTDRVFGFTNLQQYGTALKHLPQIVARRAFKTTSVAEQKDHAAEAGGHMKRCLGPFDLVCIGVGLMLGAGVFVTTGTVAVDYTGPAVVIAYLVAGFSALLSSLCYAEFSSNMSLSGGAYSYISAVFGEYLAWITVMNLVLEYMLANAAVIRGFAPYFGMLINVDPTRLVVPYREYTLDWFAFGWVLALTALLMLGTRESARFNLVVTIIHIVLVVFIIIAGFVKSNPANLQPFAPKGARGIFNGAAVVFFSYIGFDAVATSAEEVKNPKRDLPLGILGALSIVTLCYILMSLALVMMVPISALETGASFAAAFAYVGLPWAQYIVALGALLGIITGTLVGMFAVSRIIAAVARQHLLPPVLATVSERFGTPWVSTLLAGVATALIALFTDFANLLNMVSISTLFAFWIVALAVLWYRCIPAARNSAMSFYLLVLELAAMVAACIAFTVCYQLLPGDWVGRMVTAIIFVAATLALFFTFGRGRPPASYRVPLFPFVPACSVALNTFLLGQLDKMAYERFGIWTAVITGIYVLYGALAAHQRAKNAPSLPDTPPVKPQGMGLSPAGSGMNDEGLPQQA